MFRTWITRESVSITQLSGSKNFNFHIPQYSAILNWEPLKSCSIGPSKCLSLSFRRPAWGSFAFLGSRKFCLFVSVITGKSFFPNPIAKRFEQNFLQQNKKKKLRDSTKLKYFAERAKQNLSTSFNTKVEFMTFAVGLQVVMSSHHCRAMNLIKLSVPYLSLLCLS